MRPDVWRRARLFLAKVLFYALLEDFVGVGGRELKLVQRTDVIVPLQPPACPFRSLCSCS